MLGRPKSKDADCTSNKAFRPEHWTQHRIRKEFMVRCRFSDLKACIQRDCVLRRSESMRTCLKGEDADNAESAGKTHAEEGGGSGRGALRVGGGGVLRAAGGAGGVAGGSRVGARSGAAGELGARVASGGCAVATANDGAVLDQSASRAGGDDASAGGDRGRGDGVAGGVTAGDAGRGDERGGGGGQRRNTGGIGRDEVALDVGGQGGVPGGGLAGGELGLDLAGDSGGVGESLCDEGLGKSSLEHAEDGVTANIQVSLCDCLCGFATA